MYVTIKDPASGFAATAPPQTGMPKVIAENVGKDVPIMNGPTPQDGRPPLRSKVASANPALIAG